MAKADLYKISVVEGKIMLRVPPQLVGAETADIDDIQVDLHLMDADYLPERLLEIHERSSGDFEILCDEKTSKYILMVEVTDDEQEAYLNIIPPQEEEDPIDKSLIFQALKDKGVTEGIDNALIDEMIASRVHFEPQRVANGKAPVNGKDGWAELLFIPAEKRPKEGARVNLREVPMLQEVEEGQELVRLVPPTYGVDGYTISGRLTTASSGKTYAIRPGRNTSFNQERTHIIATKTGVLIQSGNSIAVEELKVMDKVDASTGHVRFDGVLKIKGNISDRYSVEALRIDVGGSVGKAKLRASGDIRIQQGALGSVIQAGGSLLVNSLDDVQASATEHVVLGTYSANSKVYCGSILQFKD